MDDSVRQGEITMRHEMLIRLASAAAMMLVIVAQGNAWPWLAETRPQSADAAPADSAPEDDAPPPPPACIAALADVAPPRCGEVPRLQHRSRGSLHDALEPGAIHRAADHPWVSGFAPEFECGGSAELRSPFDLPPHAVTADFAEGMCGWLSRPLRSVIRPTGPPRT